jgi:hypothetical protein
VKTGLTHRHGPDENYREHTQETSDLFSSSHNTPLSGRRLHQISHNFNTTDLHTVWYSQFCFIHQISKVTCAYSAPTKYHRRHFYESANHVLPLQISSFNITFTAAWGTFSGESITFTAKKGIIPVSGWWVQHIDVISGGQVVLLLMYLSFYILLKQIMSPYSINQICKLASKGTNRNFNWNEVSVNGAKCTKLYH